jgi:hypothetical protein
MAGFNDSLSERRIWTINGSFTIQQITGVQRCAYEIVRGAVALAIHRQLLARQSKYHRPGAHHWPISNPSSGGRLVVT